MNDSLFIDSLTKGSLSDLRKVPKADLHNHADLGGSFSGLIKLANREFTEPPNSFKSFQQFENYISKELHNFNVTKEGSFIAKRNTILSAVEDGVVILEASFHNGLQTFDYDIELANRLINEFKNFNIEIKPEIGIKHTDNTSKLTEVVMRNLELGFFKSIDLYGDEEEFDAGKYKKIFDIAKKYGLKLKAHVGEYGPPELIVKAVETLQLNEVQHGISAAKSSSVMNWLRNNGIQLNICPSSNIKLGVAKDIRKHPIRKLFDAGVKVTINTDDMLIFGSCLSQEFLWLYNEKLFSEIELNIIRKRALIT